MVTKFLYFISTYVTALESVRVVVSMFLYSTLVTALESVGSGGHQVSVPVP